VAPKWGEEEEEEEEEEKEKEVETKWGAGVKSSRSTRELAALRGDNEMVRLHGVAIRLEAVGIRIVAAPRRHSWRHRGPGCMARGINEEGKCSQNTAENSVLIVAGLRQLGKV
jgi:hypothetical protein